MPTPTTPRGSRKRAITLPAAMALLAAAASMSVAHAQDPTPPQAQFLFLGSYHMGNPGRDMHNTHADDVLAPKRQREIAEVVRLIERYKPTKVMVEVDTTHQAKIDAQFIASCAGTRAFEADEVEQLGYRIACDMKLPGVVAVDWNDLGPIKDEDSVDFTKAIERNAQQQDYAAFQRDGDALAAQDQRTLDQGSVRDMLARLNSPRWLAANARSYFRIGLFGSQADPAGANWVMLWQGRNLYIFDNIVRHTAPGDRVLVVYGAGHGNALRQYARDSGLYAVEDTERWLDPATP